MLIEFAGLPNSGKSSNIGVVKDFFSRAGVSTKLVSEGARTVPFSNKRRVEFACWTANQSLNSVLEANLGTPRQTLVLQDRGLFDALAFIKLLELQGHIKDKSMNELMAYFASARWTKLVDLVIWFEVTPQKSVARDLAAQISTNPGVITNVSTMNSLLQAYKYTLELYGDRFTNIVRINTNRSTPRRIAKRVTKIIQRMLPNYQ